MSAPALMPLEVEPMTAKERQRQQQSTLVSLCQDAFFLIKAYATYYRNITIPLGAFITILTVILLLEWIASSVASRHSPIIAPIPHDYTSASSLLDLQLNDVDHWCLGGGDADCHCDDPSEPSPRVVKGWSHAFELNKKESKENTDVPLDDLDLVLVGDASIEDWNQRSVGVPQKGQGVEKWFKKTFSKKANGMNAVAFGIAGDSISNLLWRFKHGEFSSLKPKVWWISIGTADIVRDQCAQEIVLLGILRFAEELLKAKSGSYIVINSILPNLEMVHTTYKKRRRSISAMTAIQSINEQLKTFCHKHEYFIYFDATHLFFGKKAKLPKPVDDKNKKPQKWPPVLPGVLVEGKANLTVAGYKLWGNAILKETKSIVFGDYESGPNARDDDDSAI